MNIPLESQVCSRGLAEKLKVYGVPQESLFKWKYDNRWYVTWENHRDYLAAFTASELAHVMERLDNDFFVTSNFDNEDDLVYVCQLRCWGSNRIKHTESADTLPDALAKMLIFLLQNKLITL